MSASAVVIGAGVSGLTTAVCDPYLAEPSDLVERWGRETLSVLTALSADADTGIRLVEGTQESRVPRDMPAWGSLVGARMCSPDDLRPGFVAGWRYRAPLVDMPRYLQYLVRRLVQAGGSIRRHRYGTLEEAMPEASVVVNCSGTGARFLAADPSVTAVRGQLVVVENPRRWLAEQWGITSRAELVDRLDYLSRTGYRARAYRLMGVSPLAWDAALYVDISRRGFGCGLLDEADAWTALKNIVPSVVGTYGSWREYADHYLLGRKVWQDGLRGTPDAGFGAPQAEADAHLRSLLDPANRVSPWNQAPWNTISHPDRPRCPVA